MRKVVAFISGLKLHVGFSAGFFVESFMGPTTRDPLRDSLWLTPLLEILFATGFLASKEGDFLCAAVSLLVSVCFMFEVGFSGDSLRFFGNRQPWPLWSPESIAESINKCTQQIERDEIKAGASSMASLPPLMLWESQESYPSPFLQDAAIPEKKNSKMKQNETPINQEEIECWDGRNHLERDLFSLRHGFGVFCIPFNRPVSSRAVHIIKRENSKRRKKETKAGRGRGAKRKGMAFKFLIGELAAFKSHPSR